MYKYERFRLKSQAKARIDELMISRAIKALYYRGHRDWVVQYWMPA